MIFSIHVPEVLGSTSSIRHHDIGPSRDTSAAYGSLESACEANANDGILKNRKIRKPTSIFPQARCYDGKLYQTIKEASHSLPRQSKFTCAGRSCKNDLAIFPAKSEKKGAKCSVSEFLREAAKRDGSLQRRTMGQPKNINEQDQH